MNKTKKFTISKYWHNNYKDIIAVLGFILIFVISLPMVLGSDYLNAYEFLSLLALICTGLVVTWYTKETFDLKDQGRKAITSSIRPIIFLYWKNPYVNLINIGRGIAKDITWEALDGDKRILSDERLYSGVLVAYKESQPDRINQYQLAPPARLPVKVRIKYSDERDDGYFSDIEIGEENHTRLIRTGSTRELRLTTY